MCQGGKLVKTSAMSKEKENQSRKIDGWMHACIHSLIQSYIAKDKAQYKPAAVIQKNKNESEKWNTQHLTIAKVHQDAPLITTPKMCLQNIEKENLKCNFFTKIHVTYE